MALSSGAALQKEEHGQTEQDLDHRGGRSAQTDLEEGGPRHAAHEIGYRDADEEGTYDTLDHDEQGLFTAIVVAGEAEEKGSEHAVDGIGLQIAVGGRHDLRVGEKMAERRSPWKKVSRAITRPAATEVRMPYFRAFFRPDRVARPHVLGHKGGHGLHIGGGDQHNEDAHLFRHPTPAEAATPKELTMAWMSRKGGPHQQLLKGHRCAQPQLSADNVPVEAQVSPGESEGQRPAAQADQEQGRQAR